jgi:tRNA A-37 threonylcarbamoyl transferase component Bud32
MAMGCCVNHIGEFDRVRIKPWTMWVRRQFGGERIGRLVSGGEFNNVRGPFDEVTTASRFARVFRCEVGFHGRKQKLYLKQYLYRSVWDFVKHLLRANRAERAFKAATMLGENGLCSPEVIATGRLRCGPVCRTSFLVTRELENARAVYTYSNEDWAEQTNGTARDKRQFIRALGSTIGRMHVAQIFHGDLRAGNIFAEKSEGKWRFYFLDNERTKKFRRLPQRLRLKNLVQINMLIGPAITRSDRMRFFKAYCQYNPVVSADRKTWIHKAVSKTNKRLNTKD